MRPYHNQDFIKVRDFLVDSYAHFQRPYNWTLERWNFSISAARIMNGISLQVWESQIAIWERDQAIVAVVNAEGEADGEAFFQMAHEHLPDDMLQEMFAFCEARLGKQKDGKRDIYLRIPQGNSRIEQIATSRNYSKLPGIEPVSELRLEHEFSVKLPKGFSFAYGDDVTHDDKGKAHARAFGYEEEPVYRERSTIAFEHMSQTPDYRADLSIHVMSPDDEIAAFATMWHDQRNQIGMLEPVGTVPRYRKMGLGKAAILQLVNQVQRQGVSRVYVGSGQDFYLRLGFRASDLYGVWTKQVKDS